MNDIFLGVNIDHVATVREARGNNYPSITEAALIAEKSGADSITIHLREDRRHIKDADVLNLIPILTTKMNLEMAVTKEMLDIACQLRPKDCCLVPEKRQELTTEGGLDVTGNSRIIAKAIDKLKQNKIKVSLFVDADQTQIKVAKEVGADIIEIHTGHYADATNPKEQTEQLDKIINASKFGADLGLQINAGHGLHYMNVQKIAIIPEIVELNIGHSIIAQAIFNGIAASVSQMKQIIINSRKST